VPGAVVGLGEPATVRGLALAGVPVLPAVTPEQVHRAWAALPADTAVVLMTPAAFEALGTAATALDGPLVAVIPGVGEGSEPK
jgi:hypothetical protein